MASVLGIDAAWTASEPSGVSLIRQNSAQRWECVAVAPSYESFVGIATGTPVNWKQPARGTSPEPKPLLQAAERLLQGEHVDVVAVDMPLATVPITGRRSADRSLSKAFGAQGCAVHSPSATRPGSISDRLMTVLGKLGYSLAVERTAIRRSAVVEVYPHPALLCLLKRDYRVQYKVSRARRYWPAQSLLDRREGLLKEFHSIHEGLRREIDGIPSFLPSSKSEGSLASLKLYEDSLDALVCAWVGARYLAGVAVPYGDETAAIWVPTGANVTKRLLGSNLRLA